MKLLSQIDINKFISPIKTVNFRFFSTKRLSLEEAREIGIQKEIKPCKIFPEEAKLYNIKVRGSRYYLYHLFLIRTYSARKLSLPFSENTALRPSLDKDFHHEINQNFPFTFAAIFKFLSFGLKKDQAEQVLLSYAIKAGNNEAVKQMLDSKVSYRGYFDGFIADRESVFVRHSSERMKNLLRNSNGNR